MDGMGNTKTRPNSTPTAYNNFKELGYSSTKPWFVEVVRGPAGDMLNPFNPLLPFGGPSLPGGECTSDFLSSCLVPKAFVGLFKVGMSWIGTPSLLRFRNLDKKHCMSASAKGENVWGDLF